MRRGGLQHPLPLPQQQHPSAGSKSLLCLPCLAGLSAGRAVLAASRCPGAQKPPSVQPIWQRCRRRVEISPCPARCACGSGEEGRPALVHTDSHPTRVESLHAQGQELPTTQVTHRARLEKETGGASKLSGDCTASAFLTDSYRSAALPMLKQRQK